MSFGKLNFRRHHTHFIDAAYCCGVVWSVYVFVCVLVTIVSPTKMAKQMEMLFAGGGQNHVLEAGA